MPLYVDFNACFFRGDFSANECNSDIEWSRTSDSREIMFAGALESFQWIRTYRNGSKFIQAKLTY